MKTDRSPLVAYFSMEVGLDATMPTYSGGLGVLAGDTLKAAADLGVSMVGVTLVHRKGYARQHLDAAGNQTEGPQEWQPEAHLEPVEPTASIVLEGRTVHIRAWRSVVHGQGGDEVPVYFLDTAVHDNDSHHQQLTDHLYGGDARYRLCQEAVLGMGGIAMLRALGFGDVHAYHMNEGHSALLVLGLLRERLGSRHADSLTDDDKEAIRRRCVFTTHTPVPAGHDQFSVELAERVLSEPDSALLSRSGCCPNGVLNMTYLALSFSRYINGVAMRHGQVSRGMFPEYPISSITNGVHAPTWVVPAFQELFDRHMPAWRKENLNLRYAVGIPLEEVRQAHVRAKQDLCDTIQRRAGVACDPGVLMIGFARRAAAYKRADLLFSDSQRLTRISRDVGPVQIVYAGKAHPRDDEGKAIIRRIVETGQRMQETVRVVYLEDYDMALARTLCGGVDVWLNTPQKPQEASGTSGMKAALNGVPSLSVLDGWWVEGHVEGVTGWSIGDSWEALADASLESESLYDKLEHLIVPMYYGRPTAFAQIMRSAISLNGSFFNAHRMVLQYVKNAYQLFSGGTFGRGHTPAPPR
jgi:starch phosphorylase